MQTPDIGNVSLICKDGVTIEVPRDIAEKSRLIKNLLHDLGPVATPIPLPSVDSTILIEVFKWAFHHRFDPPPMTEEEMASAFRNGRSLRRLDDISSWDHDFCQVDQATLFNIIVVANYLDIPALLDLTTKSVATMITGKTPEQLRLTFNIPSDLAPDEEDSIQRDNQWIGN
ncbi:hypothetical protein H696_03438 [Fonticula alba]|uniref:S-phase kinase-associated protein 1 n=1 Tax=Fonticula alba TaxID=691883 RepID=A0A058Z7W4_FONAL|nr:hypothetical protein H696_03438 [Fonticula alba]KCV69973.1 hypothetical protein H696_03438 [Fonticula alba]|eukprot:XP_009495579.1 hypothetical protein H696_03438 [Fonticula alba]